MTKPIEVITSSDQNSTGEMSLTTYYIYIQAWKSAYELRYGSEDAFITEINKLASNSNSPKIYADNFDTGSYYRGVLTFQFMNDLPVDKYPELTFTANIWLPVHSYYAIEGAGLALLSIRLQNPPKRTHVGFTSSFTEPVLRTLFPYPFNGLCTGGPTLDSFLFENLNTTAAEVKAQSNIAYPSEDDVDNCIGKSLSTTRDRKLEEAYKRRRADKDRIEDGRTRHNICREEYKDICSKLRATSLCDFIYRMRERSNYANPIMYSYGTTDTNSALSHYKDLLLLTKAIIIGIDTLLEFYLGKKELDKTKSELKSFEMPTIADVPFPP